MLEEKKLCDLCGLPVEIPGFELVTTQGLKQFCCEGCMGIFQMLNEEIVLANDTHNHQHTSR